MKIWLASYPRAGNTLFRMTLNLMYGINTYAKGDRRIFDQMEGLSELVGHKDLPASSDTLEQSSEPNFVKTHELPNDDCPAIYLVRDDRDCLVSYAHFRLKFRKKRSWLQRVLKQVELETVETILTELIQGRDLYGGWSDHVAAWRKRPGKTILVKYEDLIQDPAQKVSQALRDLGCPITSTHTKDLPSFAEMHQKWPNFFRQGTAGGGRKEMASHLQKLFWENHGETMNILGYAREYTINNNTNTL